MAEWDRKPGFDLAGKRAVVVGFANPAGRAMAMALAEAGADVATASATMDGDEVMEAKRTAREVQKLGRNSFSQGWDVTLPTNVQVSYRQLKKEFGTPGVLIFNADIVVAKPITRITDAEFGRVQQINQSGAFYATRTFLRELPEGEPGRLLYVVSLLGERGLVNMSAYATAKSGVIGLMNAVSQEGGARRVTANAISTGWMDWTHGRGPDDHGENLLLRYIPMRRFGRGEEIGALAVLLASDAGEFINGQVIHVDGGVGQHL